MSLHEILYYQHENNVLQVSFPGGMQDTTDANLEATALRETHEELGIKESDIRILGRGNFIVARGETCVLPVVGTIKGDLHVDRLKVCK